MLVLSRKKDEKVMARMPREALEAWIAEPGTGDVEITVMIVEIRPDARSVRLGLDAPLPVIIHREEVWREIARLRDQAELEEITRRAY